MAKMITITHENTRFVGELTRRLLALKRGLPA